MDTSVLLVGVGPMAIEYAKVLNAIGRPFVAVGRGEESARKFESAIGTRPILGGLAAHLAAHKPRPGGLAIVTTGVEQLTDTTTLLISSGYDRILTEKPGGMDPGQIRQLGTLVANSDVAVWLAYNRRYYGSVRQARRMIIEDGGLLSFNFEFTEWADRIAPLTKGAGVKENWFLANSTHVVDLAFFIGGEPMHMNSLSNGDMGWHRPTNFVGCGQTTTGALFSYQANWDGPGRWGLELVTKARRIILRPLEEVQVIQRNQIVSAKIEADTDIDTKFKAGLMLQVEAFLRDDRTDACMLQDQVKRLKWLEQMLGTGKA